MRAWRVNQLGHPSSALSLEMIEAPEPRPGTTLVTVEAGNINFADILLCQGIYQDRPGVPFTPGLETFGIVVASGDDGGPSPGSRVGGMSALPSGGYAEQALVRTESCLMFPPDVPGPDATVLYSTYQTAHVGIHHRGRLQAGEWLLVHGGAGGVGSAAIQLGTAAGARVIATAGGSDRAAACRNHGAHHAVDYNDEDLYTAVMDITEGHGIDVAFDPVGGDAGEVTRRLMAWEGRLVVIGFASGGIPSYPANHVLVKNYSVLGLHWSAYVNHNGRAVIEAAHEDLLRLYFQGSIRPPVSETVPLESIPDALDRLERRQVAGRLVLNP